MQESISPLVDEIRLLACVIERKEATLAEPLLALQEAQITLLRTTGEPEHVFRHVLLRDAAFGMPVRRRRRHLHLAVGRAIVQLCPNDEYVELIAYHYMRTEEDAEAAEWLEKTRQRASNAYANDTAAETILERAVELATGTNQESLEHAQALLAELTILEEAPEEARSRLEAMLQAEEEARRVLTEAHYQAAAMPNPYLEGRILVELGSLDRLAGRAEPALQHLDDARAILQRLGARKDDQRASREIMALPGMRPASYWEH